LKDKEKQMRNDFKRKKISLSRRNLKLKKKKLLKSVWDNRTMLLWLRKFNWWMHKCKKRSENLN